MGEGGGAAMGGGGGGMNYGAMAGMMGGMMGGGKKKQDTAVPPLQMSSITQNPQPTSPGTFDSGPTGQIDPRVEGLMRMQPSRPKPSYMDIMGRSDWR